MAKLAAAKITMSKRPSELKNEDLEVITAMNEVYWGERGRLGAPHAGTWSSTQVGFAADYFLQLLEGTYIDLSSQLEQRIRVDIPQELVIKKAIDVIAEFTQHGGEFLYHTDPNISGDVMKEIALRLIGKIEGTNFAYRECAATAINALTGMRDEEVLPTARNTWLEDHHSPPRIPYDADITNKALIPEAVKYARKNIPFIN